MGSSQGIISKKVVKDNTFLVIDSQEIIKRTIIFYQIALNQIPWIVYMTGWANMQYKEHLSNTQL